MDGMGPVPRLDIGHTWDGHPLPEPLAERAWVSLESASSSHLRLVVEAPLHGDPPPPGPAGPCWGLWEHEVVELFLLGDRDCYVEIEVGPHGHHLVLLLEGVRNIVARELPLDVVVRPVGGGGRWRCEADVPRIWLPRGPLRANAYAIYGQGAARRYCAWSPVPGPAPDFHRLDLFPPLPAWEEGP